MKKLILFLFTLSIINYSFAQTNIFPSTGNVGIGTVTPRSKLDVIGTAVFNSIVDFGGYSDVAIGAPVAVSGGILNNGGPTLNGVNSYWSTTSVGQYLTIDLKSIVYFDAVSFGTYWKSDHHYIPSAYHIDYSSDSLNWNNLVTIANNAQTYIYHSFQRVSARFVRLTVDSFQDGMSSAYISSLRLLTTAYSPNFGNNLWSVLPGTNGNNVVLATNGNVLIGKYSQSNSAYKMDVNGNIRADKLVVNTTGADYVFKPNYHLISLDSLRDFIERYHHLPDIPSASELKAAGLDVGEMQTLQLQKIEELTLYLLKKDEEITALKQRINELEEKQSMNDQNTKKVNQKSHIHDDNF